jgi:DNA-binding response OmpR family regulator
MVEDEEDHAKLSIKLLERVGYEVIWKENAKDAIEAYKNHPFTLCLLDIMLPDMNGDELISELFAIPKEIKPVILAVTAHAIEGLSNNLLAKGFDGYIIKPFEMREFMETVKKHMVL